MITLQNDHLSVQINSQGAELVSVIDNKTGYEFLWQADENYWGRHAPVLFPIVGRLKDNQYAYQNQTYQMSQHGFARDMEFHAQNVTESTASFYLKNSQQTMAIYPFEFSFQITYILQQSTITVSYEVLNPSTNERLYYSVGGHPAFNVGQDEAGEFKDVTLSFHPEGHYLQIPLNSQGQILRNKAKYSKMDEIKLSHSDFKNDALIFQISKQTTISLKDQAEKAMVKIKPNHMEFFGIWSPYPKKAGFICLEPWAGIADTVDTSQEFNEKYGINYLEPHQIMTHDYTMEFSKE